MKVGFIDYHLGNYHANKFHGLLTGDVGKEAGGVEIVAAYESNPSGEDWCKEKGVPRAKSISEVVQKADALLVLAPDNALAHRQLAPEALGSGKPVFLDKTLAGTVEDAEELARIGDRHNSPMMSSSSLRFAVELEELIARNNGKKIDAIFSRGFGKWRGYAVHTVSPVLRLLGGDRVKQVIDTGRESVRLVTLETAGGKRVSIEMRESDNQYEATPWQVGVLADGKYDIATIAKFDEFYANLMREALQFFKTRKSPVPVEEQIEMVALEIAADESFSRGGEWVKL